MSTGRLPHRYEKHVWLFVTWHLHGSLPENRYPPPGAPNAGQAFAWMDRHLDAARGGPMFLKLPAVAAIVVERMFRGDREGHYELGPFVVMANHVHVLIRPPIEPDRALRLLKGASAGEANLLLARTGQAFWQRESYDRLVRDRDEWRRIAAYIENNPVKAGLVSAPRDYEWSSANDRWSHR